LRDKSSRFGRTASGKAAGGNSQSTQPHDAATGRRCQIRFSPFFLRFVFFPDPKIRAVARGHILKWPTFVMALRVFVPEAQLDISQLQRSAVPENDS
jgi:hypothetical protein